MFGRSPRVVRASGFAPLRFGAIEGPCHPSVYSISGLGRSIRPADPNIWELLTAKHMIMTVEVRRSPSDALRGPPHALRSVDACPSFTGEGWGPVKFQLK